MASGVGTGVGIGIGDALSSLGDAITQHRQKNEQDREKQADALEAQARDIAANINKMGGRDAPEAANFVNQLSETVKNRNALYGPHETPALIARIQKFMGKTPAPAKLDSRSAAYSSQGVLAAAPQSSAPAYTGELGERMQALKVAADPNATPEQKAQAKAYLDSLDKTTTQPKLSPRGQFPSKDANGNSVMMEEFTDESGNITTKPIPGMAAPAPPPPKPLLPNDTAGEYTVEDPNNGGKRYGSWNKNDPSTPPEARQMIEAHEKFVADKQADEEKKTQAAEARRQAQDQAMLDRQSIAFQNSMKKGAYDDALKQVNAADTQARQAQDAVTSMTRSFQAAKSGDQATQLAILTNFIGSVTQKGARLTKPLLDEASQSAPFLSKIGAKFDDNGSYLSGLTLTEDQMRDMIKQASDKAQTLKAHTDQLKTDYQEQLHPASPADLKSKAKPKGGAPTDDIDAIVNALNKGKKP